MANPKVDVIVDLQFGSTGKGLIAGYLSTKNNYDIVISANMPNAGHTFIDAQNQKMIHKVLPSGICSPGLDFVLIAPGAIFNFERLVWEVSQAISFGYNFTVLIHEHAMILEDYHKYSEKFKGYKNIGSTQQGSAAAMIEKIRRSGGILVRHKLGNLMTGSVRVISHAEYINVLYTSKRILAEGAQGYSLGINAGFWPYCTSRDCTPARILSDMYVPIPWVERVIGTARTFPIRVGGTSGPGYRDQCELTWDKVGVEPEKTTVTNRERRIFSFSKRQIWESMIICQPNEIFLNFCNYLKDKPYDLEKITTTIDRLGKRFGRGRVRYFGWGPTVNDIVDIGPEIKAAACTEMDNSPSSEDSVSS